MTMANNHTSKLSGIGGSLNKYGLVPPPKPFVSLQPLPFPQYKISWIEIFAGDNLTELWATDSLDHRFVFVALIAKGINNYTKPVMPENYKFFALKAHNDYDIVSELSEYGFV